MIDAQGVVKVKAGLLRGSRENGVFVFRGVPFSQPPVGPLRFCAPRPEEAWLGVRDARCAGPASYQINFANQQDIGAFAQKIDPGMPGVIAGPKSVFATYAHNDVSEDCLYLDIWVPERARLNTLPVYVYYHGGANMVSSGSFELESGANLAREANVIVVRPNYRLGALGWVHFGLLDSGLPEAVNLGVQDQFAALQWVHGNIAALGGNPDNITIGGESAGATAVSHLLNNPKAHPYFRRAILQSLSPYNPWCTQQREEAEFVAGKYFELLGIQHSDELKSIEPSKLVAAQNLLARYFDPDKHVAWRALGAVADGDWVPQLPALGLSEDSVQKSELEVIIGFAKDEWLFFRGHTETIANGSKTDVLAVLSQVFEEEGAQAIYKRYEELYPGETPGLLLSNIMSFEYFKLPSLAIACNLSARGIPVYVFQFSYDLPGLDGRLRATHTGDMPFLFHNLSERELASWPTFEGVGSDDIRRHQKEISRISTQIVALYASFFHGGDPGSAWPRFDEIDWNILWLGRTIEVRSGLLKPEWRVYADKGLVALRSLENALVGNVRKLLKDHDGGLPGDRQALI